MTKSESKIVAKSTSQVVAKPAKKPKTAYAALFNLVVAKRQGKEPSPKLWEEAQAALEAGR